MTRFTNFGSRADLHRKPPSTMGHESLIQRRPSLSHPGGLKYFFFTLNYHTPRLMFISKKSKGGVHLQSAFKLKLTEKIKHSFLSSCKGARKILLSVCFFVKEGRGDTKNQKLCFLPFSLHC